MANITEAANPVAPFGAGEAGYPQNVALTLVAATSSTAQALTLSDGRTGVTFAGRFITMHPVGGRAHVAFGAAALAAADTSDCPVEDGLETTFTLADTQTHFRAYSTPGCVLHWRISSP